MTEKIPKFGVFRPLTPESSAALGNIAAVAAAQTEEYLVSQGIRRPVKPIQTMGVTYMAASLSTEPDKFPEGQFNFSTFVDKLQTDILPHESPKLSVSTHSPHVEVVRPHGRKYFALSLGEHVASRALLRQQNAVMSALRAAGSTIALKKSRVPHIAFMYALHDKETPLFLPPLVVQRMREISGSAVQRSAAIDLRFGSLVVGEYMHTSLLDKA